MATLSEADYSLVLDYPLPQEQQVLSPQEQSSRPISRGNSSEDSDSIVLYQRNYSSKNNSDVPNHQDQGQIGDFEVDMYTSSFQLGMFLRSFLISFLYSSGIGVPILLILRPCYSNFYRNYFHYSGNNFLLTSFGWLSFLFLVAKMMNTKSNPIQADELNDWINQFIANLIFSFTSAAVEAYCHQKLVVILNTIRLKEDSLNVTRFRIEYFWRSDISSRIKELETKRIREGASKEVITKEKENLLKELDEYEKTGAIQTTISRLNLDMSLHYITFFEKTPENLLRKLNNRQDLALIEKGDWLVSDQKFAGHNLLKGITIFERAVFNYKYCTKPNQYDDKKAYAYTLAVDLLLKKKHKIYATFIIIGALYTTILLYKAGPYVEDVISASIKWYKQQSSDLKIIAFLPILCNYFLALLFYSLKIFIYCLPYFNIGLFIFQAIQIMSSKYFYMEELKELISTERQRLDNQGEKSYPTLNILDSKSLEAWIRLRKIFMCLYDEKLQGIILAVTIVLIMRLIILIYVGLAYFKVLETRTDYTKRLTEAGLHSVVYFAALFIFVFYAAKVNAQFRVHRNIIRNNQQVAASLFKYYSDFIGENPIEPGTYIYNEGLKFMKKEYGENLSAETEKRIKKDYKKLAETYESVLQELHHEEAENPIKFLGIPMTKTIVKTLGTALVSMSAPLLKEGWNYLSKKIKQE